MVKDCLLYGQFEREKHLRNVLYYQNSSDGAKENKTKPDKDANQCLVIFLHLSFKSTCKLEYHTIILQCSLRKKEKGEHDQNHHIHTSVLSSKISAQLFRIAFQLPLPCLHVKTGKTTQIRTRIIKERKKSIIYQKYCYLNLFENCNQQR